MIQRLGRTSTVNSLLNDEQNETAILRFKESSIEDTSTNDSKYWAYQDDSVVYPSIAENSDADVRIPTYTCK